MEKITKCPNCGEELSKDNLRLEVRQIDVYSYYLDENGNLTNEFDFGNMDEKEQTIYCDCCKKELVLSDEQIVEILKNN